MPIARQTRATLAAVAVLFALAVAAPAGAGLLKCDSRTMTSPDYVAMKKAARRAMAGHVIDWKTLDTCMNPNSGRVWMTAIPEPQADGTVLEPGTTCGRYYGPWRCEKSLARRLQTTSAIGERQQAFDLTLPLAMAVEDARRMLARTIELARNLAAQPECGAPASESAREVSDWWKETLNWEANVTRLPPDTPVPGAIFEHDETTTVSLGEIEFDFAGARGDVEARKFQCWGVPIVVA